MSRKIIKEIEMLEIKLDKAIEALEYYADKESYTPEYTDPAAGYSFEVFAISETEPGETARKALEKLNESI